jgi:RNA polymerase sigma-70 factor (ECF subfamily)
MMAGNMAAANEPDLIVRAQDGDRVAFAQLVDEYWERLYRWLYHLTHECHAAEDIAQESFLRAFTSLRQFKGDRFQAWLFRIAYHHFLNQQRPRQKVRLPLPEDLAGRDEGPEEIAISREAMQHLARAVGRLPAEYRAPFLLRVEEELSFAEIGEVLNLTEKTARWRVFKARHKLMEVMEPHL